MSSLNSTHTRRKLFKIVLSGDSTVGKTALLDVVATGVFPAASKATVGADFRSCVWDVPSQYSALPLGNSSVNFQIWDTSGQERFASLGPIYYRGANCIVVCYAVDNVNSFQHAEKWVAEARECLGNVNFEPVLLLATKADLADKGRREVSFEQGKALADALHCSFLEVSALNGHNMDLLYPTILWGTQNRQSKTSSTSSTQKDVLAMMQKVLIGSVAAPVSFMTFSAVIEAEALAAVTMRVGFRNSAEDRSVEVLMELPTSGSGAVSALTGVTLQIGSRLIKSDLRLKEKAEQSYDDALASGKRALMATTSKTTANVVALSLGTLGPGEQATAILEYSTELLFRDGCLNFTVPVGGDNKPALALSNSSAFLEGSVTVNAESPIVLIQCLFPSSKVQMESPTSGTVTIPRTPLPCQSVTVQVFTSLPESLGASVTSDSIALSLSMIPQIPDAYKSTAFFVIVDRSGSMSGSKWKGAQRASTLFVRSLPVGCSFNVLGFGTTCSKVFEEPVLYAQDTMDKALRHVNAWDASLGGTAMINPLAEASAAAQGSSSSKDRKRIVVILITDGQDDNAARTASFLLSAKIDSLFTLGIGNDVDAQFLTQIATRSNGSYVPVPSNEGIEAAVIQQLQNASEIKASSCQLSWSPFPKDAVLEFIPKTVSLGKRTTCYALIRNTAAAAPLPESVTVNAKVQFSRLGEYKFSALAVLRPNEAGTSTLHKLALGGLANLYSEEGFTAKALNMGDLSLKHHVLTPAVAFVAIDHSNPDREAMQHSPALVSVMTSPMPTSVPDCDWNGGGIAASLADQQDAIPYAAIQLQSADATYYKGSAGCCGGGGGGSYQPPTYRTPSPDKPLPAARSSSPPPRAPAPRSSSELDALLACQNAEGMFNIGEDARKVLKLQDSLLSAWSKLGMASLNAWMTALALALLETRFAATRDQWNMVADKARAWLSANCGTLPPPKCVALAIQELK